MWLARPVQSAVAAEAARLWRSVCIEQRRQPLPNCDALCLQAAARRVFRSDCASYVVHAPVVYIAPSASTGQRQKDDAAMRSLAHCCCSENTPNSAARRALPTHKMTQGASTHSRIAARHQRLPGRLPVPTHSGSRRRRPANKRRLRECAQRCLPPNCGAEPRSSGQSSHDPFAPRLLVLAH